MADSTWDGVTYSGATFKIADVAGADVAADKAEEGADIVAQNLYAGHQRVATRRRLENGAWGEWVWA